MKKIMMILLLGISLGCGTDSGNPSIEHLNGALNADFIGPSVCQKITDCFGVIYSSCRHELLVTSDFSQYLGVDPATYPDLREAIVAVTNGQLSLNTVNQSTCNQWVSGLTCADPDVIAAYDPNSSLDLTMAFRLLQGEPACSQMLQ